MKKFLLPLAPFFLGIAVAELLVRYGLVASFILPPPSAVFESLMTDFGEYRLAVVEKKWRKDTTPFRSTPTTKAPKLS